MIVHTIGIGFSFSVKGSTHHHQSSDFYINSNGEKIHTTSSSVDVWDPDNTLGKLGHDEQQSDYDDDAIGKLGNVEK
jgi:hypothetical protein